jgi:hypothetical protein|nr:MAG TPA: virion protein [Caudoviricetes sp.]
MSRGLRNCNPGNLRLSKDKWKGLRPVQTDKDFFQFVDMPHGYRAMLITLQNYRRKHGCRTIAAMIKRYAPATENNTSGYLSRVCNDLQVPTTYEPDVSDKQVMCALAAAMSRVENGVPAVMRDIEAGWDLI